LPELGLAAGPFLEAHGNELRCRQLGIRTGVLGSHYRSTGACWAPDYGWAISFQFGICVMHAVAFASGAALALCVILPTLAAAQNIAPNLKPDVSFNTKEEYEPICGPVNCKLSEIEAPSRGKPRPRWSRLSTAEISTACLLRPLLMRGMRERN
jgi:hypothetical protein